MADKTIGELPAASEVYDDSLLVMEQQGEARSVQGALIKKYAREATAAYVEEARKSAEEGKGYRDAAAESARDAADVALHPPILKEENDHWWIWDTDLNDYKDSGIDAGVSLEVVEEIITGETGTPASVRNLGTKTDPRLQFTIPEGKKGDKGDVWVPNVDDAGTLTWEKNSEIAPEPVNITGPEGKEGKEGPVGPQGEPGVSPTVDVTKEGKTTTITITDAEGEHTATIEDGRDGTGTGDMEKAVYDPDGHETDIFSYVDEELDARFAEELPKKQDVLPYYTKQNLLINWYLKKPVNQRGEASSSATSDKIWLDMVHLFRADGKLTDSGVAITHTTSTGANGGISYRLEGDWRNKSITFSAIVDGELISMSGIAPAVYDQQLYEDFGHTRLTFQPSTLFAFVTIYFNDTEQHVVTAVKVENGGPTQTLAHKEGDAWVLNEIPDYATELAKCQRYQRVYVPNTGATNSTIAVGVTTGRSDNICFIPIPGGMRTFPTLIATGNFRYNLPGIIVYNVSSLQISPGNCSKEFIAILVTLSDSDGNNRGTFSTLSFSFADNSKLILDANL